jgi:hypothetical protein
VPLLYLILRRYGSPRASLLLAGLWCIDPFRVYYSLWLLAETFFTLVLLVAVWVFAIGDDGGWKWWRVLLLGALCGFLMLIRPIAVLIPLLAMMGVVVSIRRSRSTRIGPAAGGLLCLIAAGAVVAPWLLRNRVVAGHLALSHQSGASLAYHKVMDVMLWSQGRGEHRFNPAVHDEVRTQIDLRLQQEWAARFGPLTPAQRESLTWRRLNYGGPLAVDPFIASELLRKVSYQLLREKWKSALACFAAQGLSMLVFPLGLTIAPPAGAMPLGILGGGGLLSRIAATLIGGAYAVLFFVVLWRLWSALWERHWPRHFFVLWPALALFVLSLPSEDPRFRLPIVPLMLILALGTRIAPAHVARASCP